MSRKHLPLVIGGREVEVTGNGFRIITRENGSREPHWYAAKRAVKQGYPIRTVRLFGDLNSLEDVGKMFSRCNTLWAEMLEWLSKGKADRRPIYDGTVSSLIKCYLTDPKSPYHERPHNTQVGYAKWCRSLDRIAGARRISALVGADLRTWYRSLMSPEAAGARPKPRLAKAIIQIFRIVLQYGVEVGLPDCIKLSVMIEDMEFRAESTEKAFITAQPIKKKKVIMTYAQAEAIVLKGLETGTRRGRSVALAVSAQFEFMINQIDVIGYWLPAQHIPIREGMIVRAGKVWRPGMRFEDFESGVLDFARSKTAHGAQFDPEEYPLFQLALASVPEDERSGALVTDDDGDPVRYRVFYGMYRKIADLAGVPADVWNARARHGGGTEARAAGAAVDDVTDHLQKSDVEGTRRDYIGDKLEVTRRVARKRVAHRTKTKGAA